MGGRRLTEDEAVALLAELGFDPEDAYPGQSRPWSVRHRPCGEPTRIFLTTLKRREGSGCASCTAQNRANGQHADTVEQRAAQAVADMRDADLEPLEPYPGSGAPWLCLHRPCGRKVATRLSTVRRGSNGCASCAQTERRARERTMAGKSARG